MGHKLVSTSYQGGNQGGGRRYASRPECSLATLAEGMLGSGRGRGSREGALVDMQAPLCSRRLFQSLVYLVLVGIDPNPQMWAS